MAKPKDCPFCGKGKTDIDLSPFYAIARVWCMKCGAYGPPAPTISQAIAAWNRREPDWERKWGELVEVVANRTDQAKGGK